MSKKKHEIDMVNNSIDENILFARVAKIIEGRKYRTKYTNDEKTA